MLKLAFEKLFKMRESASRNRPGADQGFDAHEKPFIDHLEDLRHTLMKIGGTLAISTMLCFTFHEWIFDAVQIPAKLEIAEIAPGVSLWEKLELITLSPPEFVVLMLKLSFFSGVIISFPFTVYFLFQFIIPGLRQVEKKLIIPGALVGFMLFLTGAAFAFFLAAPIALKFFYTFENERISNIDPTKQAMEKKISDIALIGVDGKRFPPFDPDAEPDPPEEEVITETTGAANSPDVQAEIREYMLNSFATIESANFALRYDDTRDKIVIVEAKGGKSIYRIGEYVTFIARLVLVFGISFQLPVVVAILVKLELLTARVMRSTRIYAWIIILVASAILTPPDVITLGLMGGPMIFLYEICIIIASMMERKREKREMAEEEARRGKLAKLYDKPADELTEEEKAEMHRAEVEQYEREHAGMFDEESDHGDDSVERGSLHGGDHPDHQDDHDQHDESWHADDHIWHDGHEDDPHMHDHDESPKPVQDWPDKPDDSSVEESGHDEMESDHAEPVDLTPGDDSPGDDSPDNEAEAEDSWDEELDGCRPEGPVVDLNTATAEEMMTLPGIGPKLAEAIIDHRPFETFDDLEIVPGLTQDKITKMIDRLMLG